MDNKMILGAAVAFMCISIGTSVPYYFLHYIPAQDEIKQLRIDVEKSEQDALKTKDQCRKISYDFYLNFKKENEMSVGSKMLTITGPSWHVSRIDRSTCLVGFSYNIFDVSNGTIVHYDVFNADTGRQILVKGKSLEDSVVAESDFQDGIYDSSK